MMETIKGYKMLDYSKLNFADKPLSMEESLKNYTPMHIPQDVLEDKKEIKITMEGIQYV